MQLRSPASVAADERRAVAASVDIHDADDVDLVVVEEGVVAVFGAPDGANRGAAGIAVRHGRRLTDELDEALANLRGQDWTDDDTPGT